MGTIGLANGRSTKYLTAYSNSSATYKGDFTVGKVSVTGDATKEVWVSDNKGWYLDYSMFVISSKPFLKRGGYYNNGDNAGVFCLNHETGYANKGISFRVVCK